MKKTSLMDVVHYLPHLGITYIMIKNAIAKLTGVPMVVNLFHDLFGGTGDVIRIVLALLQVLAVVGIFTKKYRKVAALFLVFNMIGVFVMVGVHPEALVVALLAILTMVCTGHKGMMCMCKKGECTCK